MTRDYDSDRDVIDILISRLLRAGVMTSLVVILAGVLFTFLHHPAYFSSRPALGSLLDAHAMYTNRVGSVVRGVAEGRGQSIVMLGILILIATPVLRVALSIGIFAVERDLTFVVITTVVLALLILSFVLGAGGG